MRAILRPALVFAVFCGLIPWVARPAPANHFRFSIIGDRTGEAQPGVYERVWREVDQLHPDFVINVGDVIQGGNDATAGQEWQTVREVWRHYSYPLYFTPGNHDIWSEESEKLYEKYTGRPPFYSFNYRGAHFTILDNSRTENLSEGQMKFLERDLDENRARNPKFVFFHRPTVWLIPLKFRSEFALHRLLRKYQVTMVVSGHTHQFARLEKDGIVYLTVGSSGGHLRGTGFAQGWFFQHVLAEVNGAKVDLTVKEIDGPLGKGRVFKAEDWPLMNADERK
jgi:Icc protein